MKCSKVLDEKTVEDTINLFDIIGVCTPCRAVCVCVNMCTIKCGFRSPVPMLHPSERFLEIFLVDTLCWIGMISSRLNQMTKLNK